jgi:hypothetical protein
MPKTFLKKSTGWTEMKSIFVKKATGWTETKSIFVKKIVNDVAIWVKVYTKAGLPDTTTSPSIRTTNTGAGTIYDGPVAVSPRFLNDNLYGKDGAYTNYTSIFGRKFTSATAAAALPADRSTVIAGDLFTTGVTAASRLALDNKYLFYELTVQNGSSTYEIKPISAAIKMIKNYPSLTSHEWTGAEEVGTPLDYDYVIENYYYNRIDPDSSYVRWWRSSTTTAGGTLLQEETITATTTGTPSSTSRAGTSSYTPVAADIGYYIVAQITGRSSYTDHYGYTDNYAMGSFPTDGVIGSALTFSDVQVRDYYGTDGTLVRNGLDNRDRWPVGTLNRYHWVLDGYDSNTTIRIRYRIYNFDTGRYYKPSTGVIQADTTAGANASWDSYNSDGSGNGYISDISVSGSTATCYDFFDLDSTYFNGGGAGPTWWVEVELSALRNGPRVYAEGYTGGYVPYYTGKAIDSSISRSPATAGIDADVTISGSLIGTPATPSTNGYPRQYKITYGDGTNSGWLPAGEYASGTSNPTYSLTKKYSAAGTYTISIDTIPHFEISSTSVTIAALYTITFNSKGGTAVTALTQTSVGGSIAKPTDPTKTDNAFGGWSTTDGGTTAVTWPRTPPASETLYAIWTEGPTIPTSLSVATSTGDMVLTFAGGTGSQFDVYYGNSNTRPTEQQAFADYPGVTSPYTTGLTSRGLKRWFYVRRSSGTVRSNWFPASGTEITGYISLLTPPTPVITNSAQGSASLSWHWTEPTPSSTTQDSPSSWDYILTSSTATPTSGWTNITTRPTSTSPLVITGLELSTSYYLHVRAKNADATGSWTNKIGTTTAAPFVTPAWNGTMPAWANTGANGSNFRRLTSSLQYGWNNGTFSFSGSVGTSKGWDFYASTTAPASTTTVRTPTHTLPHATSGTGTLIYTTQFIYRVNPTYSASSMAGSIRPYQFGTDGNKYVRGTYPNGTWSGNI